LKGIVYIVGAGPGDPGLITVKGLEYLRRADVVLYDRLIPIELLDQAPARAERIDVGKAPGPHRRPQDEINAMMIVKAREGKIVVRLKGGDPFVFGRGGEEAQALANAGIRFEIIPGVTSATAVPAFAGIPLTHRDFASTFTVITGHLCGPDSLAVDWAALPKNGTLVILMGISRLAEIVKQLVAHGHAPETPVAVISAGTTAEQTVVEGTLMDIAEKARESKSPATIVVGDVVRLREHLAWFDPIAIKEHSAHSFEEIGSTEPPPYLSAEQESNIPVHYKFEEGFSNPVPLRESR
jgi:uroporphyrin-III C-methyltransferase